MPRGNKKQMGLKEESQQVCVRMSLDLIFKIDQIREIQHRDRSDMVRHVLALYFEGLESENKPQWVKAAEVAGDLILPADRDPLTGPEVVNELCDIGPVLCCDSSRRFSQIERPAGIFLTGTLESTIFNGGCRSHYGRSSRPNIKRESNLGFYAPAGKRR